MGFTNDAVHFLAWFTIGMCKHILSLMEAFPFPSSCPNNHLTKQETIPEKCCASRWLSLLIKSVTRVKSVALPNALYLVCCVAQLRVCGFSLICAVASGGNFFSTGTFLVWVSSTCLFALFSSRQLTERAAAEYSSHLPNAQG